jgi:hypothetical protein
MFVLRRVTAGRDRAHAKTKRPHEGDLYIIAKRYPENHQCRERRSGALRIAIARVAVSHPGARLTGPPVKDCSKPRYRDRLKSTCYALCHLQLGQRLLLNNGLPPAPVNSRDHGSPGNLFGQYAVSVSEQFHRLGKRMCAVMDRISSATENNSRGSLNCADDCQGEHLIL